MTGDDNVRRTNFCNFASDKDHGLVSMVQDHVYVIDAFILLLHKSQVADTKAMTFTG